MTKRVIVVGAGIGGLTTAAILAKAGMHVHVLEAHVYAGGCAGTFFHKGYRFDAGATLSGGFYPGGPMDLVAKAAGIQEWPAVKAEPAMVVHFPDSSQVTRWGDSRRFEEHRLTFGTQANEFWSWQERTADALWDLALTLPSWPAQTPAQWFDLVFKGLSWLGKDFSRHLDPRLIADAFRPVSVHLKGQSEKLRQFIDAQLLISAQATSQRVNALYGASALDLPRRGVVHLEGGMGAIADTLVKAIRANGGEVSFRKEVTKIVMRTGEPIVLHLKRGESLSADLVIANLTPWNLTQLLEDPKPYRLSNLSPEPHTGWGAFMVYAGIDQSAIPENYPLHHQLILGEPMGEGNTIFVSISPEWDSSRAPKGKRAITISTHTDFRPWWKLYVQNPDSYELRKQEYTQRIVKGVESIIPGFREASDLIMPGTPLSFNRFTGRVWGWVGGFPQTNLFSNWGPRILPGLWMVGDSIFPGQSTAAVALGGMRVAEDVLHAASRQVFQSRQARIPVARY